MLRPLLLSLLAVLCLFAPAPGQDDPAKLDAVREFQKQWKKFKDEPLQVEAVMTLKGNECRPAAEELLRLLKHPSGAVQQAALTVLATYHEPATFQAWIDELPKVKEQEQVAILVKVFGRSKVKTAVSAIEAAAADPKASAVVKFEAARAFQAIGEGGSVGLFGHLLGDKEPQVRMAVLDTITALKLKDHAAPAVKLLKDPEWQVQTAAVAAVGALRVQDAIQPLIDQLRENGRLQVEIADSLFKITATDNGLDVERWQTWWNQCQQITGWRIPTDEELAKKAENRKKYDALYGKHAADKKTNAFAGIPTTSTNVLFIIDVSGSMEDLCVEKEKFQGYRDFKRFTVVQTELLNTLDALTADTNFNILAFATNLDPWKKFLVPANVVNREAAKSWVKSLKPLGGSEAQDLAAAGLGGSANLQAGKTNTLGALLYAFGIDPEKPPKPTVTGFDKNAIKSPLDTVYFLSDGRPSVGKLIDTNEILKEVRKYNEVYRIVFHAIAIGEFQKEFLQVLAEQNGGVFVDLGR